MRQEYPHTLYRFEAYVERKEGEYAYPGLREAYGGIIQPNCSPLSQEHYERQVKKHLINYRRNPRIVRLEIFGFSSTGEHIVEERMPKRKLLVKTREDLVLENYLSRGGR